ncbi:hypothetical protein QJ48_14565 [Paenibacillus sp. A3]|uniref:hypothetical protein n=1 Tax=Paenibacillus sp. A3 TaxID=1337054 RepID=UPI0006D55468|nr:hypothetical protein [Paenibacillus sp. A3]KPV58812.1 hypothetical protein QJ48_14565 [Paenibacillus sp. A3]
MARQTSQVPFGYELPNGRDTDRGSLWIYDAFEDYTEQELVRVLALASGRGIAKAVFYPLHEETVRRMEKRRSVAPYYERVEALEALLAASDTDADYAVEPFEGKRKKYTPVDTAFRFLEEKYAAPHFVWMTKTTAELLAGYESFETWIKKIRWFVSEEGGPVTHPRLQAYAHRWDPV